jgi:hypothetical protein
MKTIKGKIKLVETAFSALYPLENITWTNYPQQLQRMCLEEEKQHRGGDFNQFHPNTVSATIAARMFAVKRIAGYLTGDRMPRGKDFLHTQRSCFYAAGLVDAHRKIIRKAWRKLPIRELAELDYCEFVGKTV